MKVGYFYSYVQGKKYWSADMEYATDKVPRLAYVGFATDRLWFGEWQEWAVSKDAPGVGDWYIASLKATEVKKLEEGQKPGRYARKLVTGQYLHNINVAGLVQSVFYPTRIPLQYSAHSGNLITRPILLDGEWVDENELTAVSAISAVSQERHLRRFMVQMRDGNFVTRPEHDRLPICPYCHDRVLSLTDGGDCPRCVSTRLQRRVRGYHQRPGHGLIFYKQKEENLFLGVEIEQDCYGTGNEDKKVSEAIKLLMDTDPGERKFYLNSDGSLNRGFEMITMPHSMEMWMAERDYWKGLVTNLAKIGMRAHDTQTCGQHIHVSRAALKPGALEAIITMYEANFPDFLHFSRRTLSELERWAHRYTPYGGEKKAKKGEFNPNSQPGRGCAINQQPQHTLEFRFFKGTLNPTTLYANLQLAWSMCLMANKKEYRDRADEITFDEIINFSGFDEIKEYWAIRKTQARERIKENA